MKRRDFLRVTLVGGAAAAVAPLDLWGKGNRQIGFYPLRNFLLR